MIPEYRQFGKFVVSVGWLIEEQVNKLLITLGEVQKIRAILKRSENTSALNNGSLWKRNILNDGAP